MYYGLSSSSNKLSSLSSTNAIQNLSSTSKPVELRMDISGSSFNNLGTSSLSSDLREAQLEQERIQKEIERQRQLEEQRKQEALEKLKQEQAQQAKEEAQKQKIEEEAKELKEQTKNESSFMQQKGKLRGFYTNKLATENPGKFTNEINEGKSFDINDTKKLTDLKNKIKTDPSSSVDDLNKSKMQYMASGDKLSSDYKALSDKVAKNPKDLTSKQELDKLKKQITNMQSEVNPHLAKYDLEMLSNGDIVPTKLDKKDTSDPIAQGLLKNLDYAAGKEDAIDDGIKDKYRSDTTTPKTLADRLKFKSYEYRRAYLKQYKDSIKSQDVEKFSRVYEQYGFKLGRDDKTNTNTLTALKIDSGNKHNEVYSLSPEQRDLQDQKTIKVEKETIKKLEQDRVKAKEIKDNKKRNDELVKLDKQIKTSNDKISQIEYQAKGREYMREMRANAQNSVPPSDSNPSAQKTRLKQLALKINDIKDPVQKEAFAKGALGQIQEDAKSNNFILGSKEEVYNHLSLNTDLNVTQSNGKYEIDVNNYTKNAKENQQSFNLGNRDREMFSQKNKTFVDLDKQTRQKVVADNFKIDKGPLSIPKNTRSYIEGFLGNAESRKVLATDLGFNNPGDNIPEFNQLLAKNGYQIKTDKQGNTVAYGDGKTEYTAENTYNFADVSKIKQASLNDVDQSVKEAHAESLRDQLHSDHNTQLKLIGKLEKRNSFLEQEKLPSLGKNLKQTKAKLSHNETLLNKEKTALTQKEEHLKNKLDGLRKTRQEAFNNSNGPTDANEVANKLLNGIDKDNFKNKLQGLKDQLGGDLANKSPEFKKAVIKKFTAGISGLGDSEVNDSLRAKYKSEFLSSYNLNVNDDWELSGTIKGRDDESIINSSGAQATELNKLKSEIQSSKNTISDLESKVTNLSKSKSQTEADLETLNIELKSNKEDLQRLKQYENTTASAIDTMNKQLLNKQYDEAIDTGLKHIEGSQLTNSYFRDRLEGTPKKTYEAYMQEQILKKQQANLDAINARATEEPSKTDASVWGKTHFISSEAKDVEKSKKSIDELALKLEKIKPQHRKQFLATLLKDDSRWGEAMYHNSALIDHANAKIGGLGVQVHQRDTSYGLWNKLVNDDTGFVIVGNGTTAFNEHNTGNYENPLKKMENGEIPEIIKKNPENTIVLSDLAPYMTAEMKGKVGNYLSEKVASNNPGESGAAKFKRVMEAIAGILQIAQGGVQLYADINQARNAGNQSIAQMHRPPMDPSIYKYASLGASVHAKNMLAQQFPDNKQAQELAQAYGSKTNTRA